MHWHIQKARVKYRVRRISCVIKFIRILQSRTNKVKREVKDSALTAADLLEAENFWIIDIQDQVKSDPKFKHWKAQLVLIQDEESILRSKGDYLKRIYLMLVNIRP